MMLLGPICDKQDNLHEEQLRGKDDDDDADTSENDDTKAED